MAVLTVEPVEVIGELARRGYSMATPDVTPLVHVAPGLHTGVHDTIPTVHIPGIHVPIHVPGIVHDVTPDIHVPIVHIPIIPHGPVPHVPIVDVPDIHIPLETPVSRYARFLPYLPYLVLLVPDSWVLELT